MKQIFYTAKLPKVKKFASCLPWS